MQTIHTPYPQRRLKGQQLYGAGQIRALTSADSNKIEYGDLVLYGAEEGTFTRPSATFTESQVAGITRLSTAGKPQNFRGGDKTIEFEETVDILQKGFICVYFTQAVTHAEITQGVVPYFVHTDGGNSDLNTFRKDDDGGKASKIPGRIVEPVEKDSVGIIQIDILISVKS